MLTDVNLFGNPVCDVVALVNNRPGGSVRLQEGVYEIGHFSLNHMMVGVEYDEFFEIDNGSSYGVCDNLQQVFDEYPSLKSSEEKFVLSMTKVVKADQEPEGGWRWHKWGPYIGTHNPQHEYLYDESIIEQVYVYSIFKLI